MTNQNYNNGNWHPWTGGDCPVHPDSKVDVMFSNGETCSGNDADQWDWSLDICTNIVAFKVTKEFRAEPREFWINLPHCKVRYERPDDIHNYIHVREVLE
jgi:hypothetical protein